MCVCVKEGVFRQFWKVDRPSREEKTTNEKGVGCAGVGNWAVGVVKGCSVV